MFWLCLIPSVEPEQTLPDECPTCGRAARESIFDALRRIAIVVPNYSPRGERKTAQSPNA
jgi:hypothetical protein